MAHSSAVRRKLFMHPAHRTVGVSGGCVALGPYCRTESFSAEALAITPMRVALVACRLDADARAALALLEQAIARRGDMQCRRVDFECDRCRIGKSGGRGLRSSVPARASRRPPLGRSRR